MQVGNAARYGGALYAFSPLQFGARASPRAFTLFRNNSALEYGGAAVAEGPEAKFEVESSHRVMWEGNEARLQGGALRMNGGASLVVVEEACDPSCSLASRGNGRCDTECLSKACNWDGTLHMTGMTTPAMTMAVLFRDWEYSSK